MSNTDTATADAAIGQPDHDGPRSRQCLKCKATFQSRWNGERICSRCKSSKAWRAGVPSRSYAMGRGY